MKNSEIVKIANKLSNQRLFRKITWSDCGYIDVLEILREYNINFKKIDFKLLKNGTEDDACVYLNNNKYTICVQYDLIEERKRYAIAVQIGHIFLNHINEKNDFISLFSNKTGYKIIDEMDPKLIEAIFFAKELLMPKEDVLRESQKPISLFLSRLTEIFYVSNIAMRNRLDELSILNYYDK